MVDCSFTEDSNGWMGFVWLLSTDDRNGWKVSMVDWLLSTEDSNGWMRFVWLLSTEDSNGWKCVCLIDIYWW